MLKLSKKKNKLLLKIFQKLMKIPPMILKNKKNQMKKIEMIKKFLKKMKKSSLKD